MPGGSQDEKLLSAIYLAKKKNMFTVRAVIKTGHQLELIQACTAFILPPHTEKRITVVELRCKVTKSVKSPSDATSKPADCSEGISDRNKKLSVNQNCKHPEFS